FETVHYKKVPFNDSLSSEIYDVYLKTLDEGKNYFLKSDIENFEQYRPVLLKDLSEGDLSAMFHMFNVYEERYFERLNYSTYFVDCKFNFTKDEYFSYNKKDEDMFNSHKESEETSPKQMKYDMLILNIREEEGNEDKEKRVKSLT